MAGILLESGVVLVPLACAALYIIVTSNTLLVVFVLVAAATTLATLRLRYHYSSGARADLVVHVRPPPADEERRPDRASGEFGEIIHDAQQHCDVDAEDIRRSGPLLSTAVLPASTQYNTELFGPALSYDHRCFYVCGQPTWVLAADFDYWRLPVHASADLAAGAARDAWRR
ncbi:hypothetical protein H4R19_005972, partial [Coemansia spiralis]